MDKLEFHIAFLLTKHECVIVPGFGAFIVWSDETAETADSGMFSPPMRYLSFSSEINCDDGLLVNSVAREHNLTQEEATALTVRFVEHWIETLNQGHIVRLPWVGRLKTADDGTVAFTPAPNLSCNAELHGMVPVRMTSLEEIRVNPNAHQPKIPKKQSQPIVKLPKVNKPFFKKEIPDPEKEIKPIKEKKTKANFSIKKYFLHWFWIDEMEDEKEGKIFGTKRIIIYCAVAATAIGLLLLAPKLLQNEPEVSKSRPPVRPTVIRTSPTSKDSVVIGVAEQPPVTQSQTVARPPETPTTEPKKAITTIPSESKTVVSSSGETKIVATAPEPSASKADEMAIETGKYPSAEARSTQSLLPKTIPAAPDFMPHYPPGTSPKKGQSRPQREETPREEVVRPKPQTQTQQPQPARPITRTITVVAKRNSENAEPKTTETSTKKVDDGDVPEIKVDDN